MHESRWRAGALAAAYALLLVATAIALNLFAHREFDLHLRDRAAYALALAATGGTPYRWWFKAPEDLVSGRPFGADEFRFRDGDLHIDQVGRPFEIGLPLGRPLDLYTFPHFLAVFDSGSPGSFRIEVREHLHGGDLLISDATAYASGVHHDVADLDALAWHRAGHDDVRPSPRTAALLRVRFAPSAPGLLVLHRVALQRAPTYRPLDLGKPPVVLAPGEKPVDAPTVYRLPLAAAAQEAGIEAIAATLGPLATPLILLPQHGRVEQQIALRNAVYARLPSAILIPESAYEATFAQARALISDDLHAPAISAQWRLVAAFGLLLLVVRLRSPRDRRWRALVEIALTLAAPIWLIVGGHYDGTLHTPQTVLIGFTVVYAISLSMPRAWHWNGDRSTWLLAGLVALLALAIGLSFYGGGSHLEGVPGLRHVVRYLAWALLQQYLVCAVCTERWHVVTGNAFAATYLGALGFALLHTPNATLMIATFVGGLCWCAIYLQSRALLPLAFSHAASALLLSALLPTDILHSAEVSVRFFQ